MRNLMIGFAVAGSSAMAGPLPLRPGTYVAVGQSCRGAPFAAMSIYDGRGLGGPHASACNSRILARRGDIYRVSTTCRANGDGSPTPASTVVETLRIRGATSFDQLGEGPSVLAYRRCAG